MKIDFTKYSGHGNDFVLIDLRDSDIELSKDSIISICNRRFGVGADGIIFISLSSQSDFSMRIKNCDGSEADMCGNAARIAVYHEYLKTKKSSFKFQTLNSRYEGKFEGGESCIKMSELYDVNKYDISDLGFLSGMYLNTGVPHTVVETKNIEELDLINEGLKIRHDSRFTNGTNVCFFEVIKKNEIKFRVYERGVEGETHCCGTGIVATAVTCKKLLNWDGEILVHCLGGEVKVSVSHDLKEILYKGKVDLSFKGSFEL